MEKVIQRNAYGGQGEVILEKLLDAGKLNGKCGLYARVTIPAGSSLGYHVHHGDAESYYVLSGRGVYDDDGVKRPVGPGEVTYTGDGHGHAFDNTGGAEDLVFMALIILS